jgi:hypothetical protein
MYEVHSPQVPKYLRGKLALEKLSKAAAAAATYRGVPSSPSPPSHHLPGSFHAHQEAPNCYR